jgi:hypothetical protein
MKDWFRFLRSLETEGGSIVVLLALVLLFSFFVKNEFFKDAESQLYFILGALVGLLKGNNDRSAEAKKTIAQLEKNGDVDKDT